MYYSTNHIPSKEDHRKSRLEEIFRLKSEIILAKAFIKEAEKEIQKLEEINHV